MNQVISHIGWRQVNTPLLIILLAISGIDGFLLLEPLREAGSRPYFLILLIFLAIHALKGRLRLASLGCFVLAVLLASAMVGFLVRGINLAPFGEKNPVSQFIAQGALFVLGFCPISLRLRLFLSESTLDRALWGALLVHALLISLDAFAIVADLPRPTEGSFFSGGRVFPIGVFSEPSYLAGYVAIILSAALYRRPLWQIVIFSTLVGIFFYFGQVRSFFPVFAVGITCLALCRWGLTWRVALVFVSGLVVLVLIASQLNLSSVEENLSSAYRLGNTMTFAQHAIGSDWLIGSGFGSSHFLYPKLDHVNFLYLSGEFLSAMQGEGFRVPVFNLWIRLCVEVGIPATVLLVCLIFLVFRNKYVTPQVKILLSSSVAFSLSTDSYIYGVFGLALLMAFSLTIVMHKPVERLSASNGH